VAPKSDSGAAAARGPAVPPEVSLISPDTNIRARAYIDLRLAAKENTIERMDARNGIRVTDGNRVISDGAEMVYLASSEQYEIKAGGTTPVTIVERQGSTCRENRGKSVVFSKGGGRVIIDGNAQIDTSTAPSKGTCGAGGR
jgi:hypothetical protein